MRKVLKNVERQKEDHWKQLKNLKIRTFYNPVRDHFLQRSSKVFYFVNYFEKQLTRPKFYYHFLIIIFFLQLIGSVSSSQDQVQDKILYYILKGCEYIRISPLLKDFLQISQEAQGIIINLLLILLEVFFLITFYILGRSTTNLSDKKFKNGLIFMGYTTFFLEMQRWILFNIQADITSSMMFCVQGQQNLSNKCQNNIQYQDNSLRYILIIINIVLGIGLSVINSIIHSIAQFIPINGLRSQFTYLKLFDYSIILVAHVLSYFGSLISLFAFEILALFYIIQYFFSYPLFTKSISHIYAVFLNFYLAATILFHIRHYNQLSDSNFLFIFLILGSFMGGVLVQWERIRLHKSRTFDFSFFKEQPQETVNALLEIVNLLMEKTYQNQLTLLGIFEVHQRYCIDSFCPCKYQIIQNEDYDSRKHINNGSLVPINAVGKKFDIEQFKTTRKNIYSDKEDIEEYEVMKMKNMSLSYGRSLRQTMKQSISSSTPKQAQFSEVSNPQVFTQAAFDFEKMNYQRKQKSSFTKSTQTSTLKQTSQLSRQSTIKQKSYCGHQKLTKINFSVLQQDFLSFKKWTLQFIDYQYEQLLRHLYSQREFQLLISLGIRYIYFEIEIKANFIKALYFVRKWAFHIDSKPYYFQVVEKSLSDLIENEIKNKDKALKYSIRKKDNLEARGYENFDSFVVTEEIKKFFNHRLQDLIKLKQIYFEKLIIGYASLYDLYKDQKNIIKKCKYFQTKVEFFNLTHKNSPHFIKLLTIFYAVLFQDLKQALYLENKLTESLKKVDYYISQYTILGQEILQGNVATIIAHFRTKVGKILKYSASAPIFFGYKKLEFDSLQSVNEIMPQTIGEKHDLFLERFIDSGQSKILRQYRQAFAKSKQGFIFPVKIYINYFFELHNDFIFSSLIVRKPSNSQYVLIDQHGFIDSFSQNFFEFCQIVCPQITVQQLVHSNMQLFIEDLDSYLRQCSHKGKINNLKCVLKLNSSMNEMIIRFKNYWRKDRHINKLIFHIIKILEEFEDEVDIADNEDIFQFDIKANLIQNKFSLISGEQLTLYILEIIRITPIKNNEGNQHLYNSQFSQYSQDQTFSNMQIPSMTTLINNKQASFKNEIQPSKQIKFQEEIKLTKQDTHSTKITSNPFNSCEGIDHEELNFQQKNTIKTNKSMKFLDEKEQNLFSQLDEMDHDIDFMNEQFEQKLSTLPKFCENNNLRFISNVNSSCKIIENDCFMGLNQKNQILDQKFDNIPFTVSQRNIISVNSHNNLSFLPSQREFEQIHSQTNMVSPRESLFNYSQAQINNQQEKIFNAFSNNNLLINDCHIMDEQENFKSLTQLNDDHHQRAIEITHLRIKKPKKVSIKICSQSSQKVDQIEDEGSLESLSPKVKKIKIKNCNVQLKMKTMQNSSKSQKQIDILQSQSEQNNPEQNDSRFTKATAFTDKESKTSKKTNKQEVIMKIQQATEKNNVINIECALSDDDGEEEDQNQIQKKDKQNNNDQNEEKFSIRSEGKNKENDVTSEKSSRLSEVAKKVQKIHRIAYSHKKQNFIAFTKVIFLFIFCLHIFAAAGSQIFCNNYVNQIIEDSNLYQIQETTTFSYSQAISSVFGLQNDSSNQVFYQLNLNQSYKKLISVMSQLLNSHVSEYNSLNQEYELQNSITNQLESFLSDIFKATSQNNYYGIQTPASNIFQLNSILENFSEKIKDQINNRFTTIQNMNLIILILVVALIFIAFLLLIKINFKFRDIIQQYLFISAKISQNEAQQEYIKLSNIISFLEQNEDQYIQYDLERSHMINSKQIHHDKLLIFQKQDKTYHSQVLYNNIKHQNFIFIKMIIFTSIVASMSVILQAIIFAVTYKQLNTLVEPLNQYKEYSQKISELSCLNTAHQLINYQPQLDSQKFSVQFFNNNIKQISSYYLESFQIIPIKGQQYYYSAKIQQLNQANSCLIFDSSPQLQEECASVNYGVFSEGLLKVLRQMFQFYLDTPAQSDPTTFDYVKMSMILLDILDLSQQYFQKSIELIESEERIQKFILIILGNIFIIIFQMVLAAFLVRKMERNIKIIKYSIIFIPNKKLIEDNSTLQLIKAIS
ncbi:transmembrane protein, putative (macronuclear) [Tetrahymena thermophila SB210]|uniref:Transmembrane protein, putative n=1 Tax=Tetrahymena thermophila (strain SB210) TaxID=312017 RepID=Q22E75_TETTS|nr:transmembrane protein, putative [Tetrahymena thermophila SB210]EAR83653.2 transmembrane protein, putative [Tetrahymena thermophila SB210]|eukprot:XP_001031316.2 transmembrane protein, putative [Tetrahymena thermophila SB210]